VVSTADAEDLIRQNKVSGGMILKLEACKRALSAASPKCVSSRLGTQGIAGRANGMRFPGTRITSEYPASAAGWRSEIDTQKNEEERRRKRGGRAQRSVLRDVSRHLMNTYKRPTWSSRMGVAAMFSIKAGRSISIFWAGLP